MAKTATAKKSIYGVHPGVLMTKRWIGELKQKTGRSLEEWLNFIKREGPTTEQERRDWLKTKHGLGTNIICKSQRNTSNKCFPARRKTCDRFMTRCSS